MYAWISRTLNFGLQFSEKKCGLYMDVYGTQKSHLRPSCTKSFNYSWLLTMIELMYVSTQGRFRLGCLPELLA